MSDATPATQELIAMADDLPAGPTPVAWMYSHDTTDHEKVYITTERDAVFANLAGTRETPLSPTSLVTDLLEALRECADDLEAEIEARRGAVLNRTMERDLDTVRRARAAIAKAEGRS